MSPVARMTATSVALFCCSVSLAACAGDEPRQCAAGETLCAEACVRLDRSHQSCGACGNSCSDSQFCLAGACACPEGSTACGEGLAATCIDPANDPANCGGCGNACQTPLTCIEGQCGCPPGQSLCGDSCVSLKDDPENCGACGNACAELLTCVSGWCSSGAGVSMCGDQYVSLYSPENCGFCGASCPEGYSCNTRNRLTACAAEAGFSEQAPEYQDFELETTRGIAAAVADLDGDGLRDLLVMTDTKPGVRCELITPQLRWLRGTGGGRFEAPVILWTAGGDRLEISTTQVSVARLRPPPAAPQVILSSYNRCILFPDGVLAATPPAFVELSSSCLAFDADGDGVEELATAQGIARLGEDGTLSAFVKPTCWGAPYAAADFNGDGRLDLLSRHLLLNRGDGSFVWGRFPLLEESYTQGLVVELDGDGLPDVVLAGSSSTMVLRRTSSGFEEVRTRRGPAGKVGAGDLDGDGLTELVTSRAMATGELYVVQNHAGKLSALVEAPWEGLGADLLDTDGDGRSEVLVFTAKGLRVYLPQPSSSTWPVP